MKQRGPQHPTPPPPERLPSPALQPINAPTTWGTRQRIAEHLSKLDQESLDHLLDKVEPANLSTAALASATKPSFSSTTASFAALTSQRHRSPRHHRPRQTQVMRTGNAPPFIAKFHPQPGWLWRQWRGTVLQQCWVPACSMMLVSIGLIIVMEPVSARVNG